MDTQGAIKKECTVIMEMLLQKNKDYGNSAFSPVRVFSKADNIEQINIRIDDKLSRIKNITAKTFNEDTELDLIGYLILKRIAMQEPAAPELSKGFYEEFARKKAEALANGGDMITITKKEYLMLRIQNEILNRLDAGGVDNWEWYGESMDNKDLQDLDEWQKQERKRIEKLNKEEQ